jgi:methionyl aminopeptidase
MVAGALEQVRAIICPNIKTAALDEAAEKYIRAQGGEPAFKGYRGYPANICVSVNEEVVHGIPGERKLKEGDIVSVDIGVGYKGYYADAAATFEVGKALPDAKHLVNITRLALEKAIDKVGPGMRLSEISATIQGVAESNGFGVVRELVGHGVGQEIHEDPQIPNYISAAEEYDEVILKAGMTLAIEPMITMGTYQVKTLSNGWTVVTKDGKLAAHFEHTVAVTEDGRRILTVL